MSDASIALNRFGLGARAGESPPRDPRRWLLDGFARYEPRPAVIAAAPTTTAAMEPMAALVNERRRVRREGGENALAEATALKKRLSNLRRTDFARAVDARVEAALATPAPFVERMVHFWSNHFAVSVEKLTTRALAGPMEFECVRPHVLGRFRDMLHAVERHPAMLLYLDQAGSVGPGSEQAQRAAANGRKRGLNENLAREIMELHTLGVRGGGYTQADVTEFARALTGWTAGGLGGLGPDVRTAEPGRFIFVPIIHEPGARTVLGRRYAQEGEAQAAAILDDLAAHPATAQHLATKLSRHFAGDDPPPAMVARVAAAFTRSNGDLPTVYRAIIDSPEAWRAQPAKFRTPWEWALATQRALGVRETEPAAVNGLMDQLGQPIWRPGQPKGYDDAAASWAGPDAVLRRVEAAERMASRLATPVDARALAAQLFPGAVSPTTAAALAGAESPGQALALLLVAPEMMRR